MKNKVLSMLVLLMMAATGAWAQSTYKVTMKEGTEDATNWTITPTEATTTGVAKSTQVTATYSGTKRVKSVKAKKANPLATPLTIEALQDGSSITVSNPKGMLYSTDGGITKTAVFGEITLEKAGDKVHFYGTATAYGGDPRTTIGGSGSLKVYGNIMSLINETDFATEYTTLSAQYTFPELFRNNTSITDASGLLLPATTLTNYCYYSMFYGCTSLVAGPNLPATTLQPSCYASMFRGCTSLKASPTLPATTLQPYCYSYMFYGCESLTSLTCLATDIDASSCIYGWLDGVGESGTLYVDESMKDRND